MKHLYNSYNKLILVFQKTLGKYQRLNKSGKNISKQTILKKRLEKWAKQLQGYKQLIKKSVAAAAVFGAAALFSPSEAKAQTFAAPILNPFGLDSGFLNRVALGDLDNDGDLDMVTGEYNGGFMYYKNSGTSTVPSFDPFQYNPFSLSTTSSIISFPALADLDNDGDLDMMVGSYYGNLQYYQNTGTAIVPVFAAPIDSAFGFTFVGYNPAPTFADLDNDGDLDMMIGEYYGDFYYFQNTGSVSAPAFAAPVLNAFGLSNVGAYLANSTFADLDGDGDMDMLSGEYYGDFVYYENAGSVSAPSFGAPVNNPFGLTTSGYVPFPCFGDLDSDGDMDIMAGEVYGAFNYFENTSVSSVNDKDLNQSFVVYPNPSNTFFNCVLNTTENVRLNVFNTSGQVVYSTQVVQTQVVVHNSEWPTGLYTVRIETPDGTFTKKIMKW